MREKVVLRTSFFLNMIRRLRTVLNFLQIENEEKAIRQIFQWYTVLWSSFFVTLLAKKIPLFIQLFLPHEALHNYCNYADAHNYIQHMQIPLPLDKVTAPF